MPMFEDRERGFEVKYAHDEKALFLATARRDKLFARRIAERLGLPDDAAQSLTAAVLAVPDGPGHDPALIAVVETLLAGHGRGDEAARLWTALQECGQATQQPAVS